MLTLPFTLDFLTPVDAPWGPQKSVSTSSGLPYAPYSKLDRLGKAADWYSAEQQTSGAVSGKAQKGSRDPFHAYGLALVSRLVSEEDGEDLNLFEVVDTKAAALSQGQNQQQKTVLRGRGGAKRGGAASGPRGNAYQRGPQPKAGPQTPQQQRLSYWNTQNQNQIDDAIKRKKHAIEILLSWERVTEIELSKLNKLLLDLGAAKDGELISVRANPALIKQYNKTFDRLSLSLNLNKKTVGLKVFAKEAPENDVDTPKDHVLMESAKNGSADVVVTSEILALIMASPKSHFPWSIKITKDVKTGALVFLKTEVPNMTIVDENDSDLFNTSFRMDENGTNSYVKLLNELKAVNYNLRRFVSLALPEQPETIKGAKIDSEPDLKIGTIYKYKVWHIPENTRLGELRRNKKLTLAKPVEEEEEKHINVVVRTELDLLQKSLNGEEYETAAIHALNQYKATPSLDWKTKLIANRGAIMSTELRKNNHLLSKWIIRALLADTENIKLGFVARDSYSLSAKHSVLGVFNYKPADLARQLNLQISNGWAIFKSVVDIVNHAAEEAKEGKDSVEFVLVRDAEGAKLGIYKVD